MSDEICSFCKQPKALKTCAFCQRSMADYGPAAAEEVKQPAPAVEPTPDHTEDDTADSSLD